jgi:hypothetical protein
VADQIAYKSSDRQNVTMAGILVGYARVSTFDQHAVLDAEVRDLKAAGCEEIFSEQVSAVGNAIDRREPSASPGKGTPLFVPNLADLPAALPTSFGSSKTSIAVRRFDHASSPPARGRPTPR